MGTDKTKPPALNTGEHALFLDFDGVLVEIAPRPDAIEVPTRLGALLANLHASLEGAIAVVSGRMMADLDRYLPSFPGTLVGSHGAERKGMPDVDLPDGLDALHADLRQIAEDAGLLAEIKTRGGALHFREAPEREETARNAVLALVAAYPAFRMQPAKMAFELKPKGATKDAAVAALMEEAPFAGRRPVYLGDDATDEPAMAWVSQRGGLAVKIGDGETVAPHRLGAPGEVLDWLARSMERG